MLLKLQVGRVIICNRIIKLHRIGIIFDTYSASMELVIFVAKDREHYSVGDKSASYGRHNFRAPLPRTPPPKAPVYVVTCKSASQGTPFVYSLRRLCYGLIDARSENADLAVTPYTEATGGGVRGISY